MRALVVGGTGFVGMNLVRALVAGDHSVLATRRLRGNTLFARRQGAPLIKAELDDVRALTEAMTGRDVVFNCAGHYPRYSLDKEAELVTARRRVRNTLEAARRAGVQRYVLTSSIATVGPPRDGGLYSDERDAVEPASLAGVYHSVKSAIEEEVLAGAHSSLDVMVVVPTAIVGELDVKAGTGALIVGVGNQTLPFLVDGPTNVVDADDLARAHIAVAERGRAGERYIVGGHNLSVASLLRSVAELLAVPLDAHWIATDLAGWRAILGEARARAAGNGTRPTMARELIDMVRFGRHVQNAKAAEDVGIAPPTPLSSTLKKACDWYVRHRYVRLAQGDAHARHSGNADTSRHREHHSAYSTGAARRD